MPALLEACPSFMGVWERHLEDWAADSNDRGGYIDVGVFALHLVDLLDRGATDEFPAVFQTVERLLGQDDEGVRYLVKVGLIEDLGNIGSSRHGWPWAAKFRQWFGPNANRVWDDLHEMWGTSDRA